MSKVDDGRSGVATLVVYVVFDSVALRFLEGDDSVVSVTDFALFREPWRFNSFDERFREISVSWRLLIKSRSKLGQAICVTVESFICCVAKRASA